MMEKFWAVDYVGECCCELVVGNQLYASEAAAQEACNFLNSTTDSGEGYEVNWYTMADLEDDVFDCNFTIDDSLKVITD